jgi:hypothetical protein
MPKKNHNYQEYHRKHSNNNIIDNEVIKLS